MKSAFSVILLAIALTCLGGAASRPNILFIFSDDHATHAIGAYGSRMNRTPAIDRLAREGMRFDRSFCVNSICAPSRAVVLTGKYNHLNGVRDNVAVFDGAQQTLPKLMGRAGYRTALVGKWHLKSTPTGFDYTDILPGQGEYHDPVMIENGKSRRVKGYVTDIITDQALHWLKRRESPDKPFFLMLQHKAPHADWEPDEKHQAMYADADIPLPETFNDDYRTRTAQIRNHRLHVGPKQWELHFKRFGKLPAGMDEQQTREWVYQVYMKNYLRCVASMDANIGRVLDYLDESGLAENTIVVYSSDQGFFLGDHGLYDKRFMYEPSLRTPLVIRQPGKIRAGSVSEDMVLNMDFAPTLLDLAGVKVPDDMQGRSFQPITRGRTPADWREDMYYQYFEQAFGLGPHEGVRTRHHKLIHYQYGDNGWELFDLRNDSNELNNLYGVPEHQPLVRDLKARLADLKRQYRVPGVGSREAASPAKPQPLESRHQETGDGPDPSGAHSSNGLTTSPRNCALPPSR